MSREMPQRLLYQEVRMAVDRMCPASQCGHARCSAAKARLLSLAADNPHNFWSTKVLHNVGKRRLARIVRVVDMPEARLAHTRGPLSKSMRGSRELVDVRLYEVSLVEDPPHPNWRVVRD